MTFTAVVKEVLSGKRITREGWADNKHYVTMQDYLLHLHKSGEAEETLHPWIISEEDLLAEDWVVV